MKRVLATEAGRRQPCQVLARLAGWQLWRRSLRRPMAFETVTGAKLRLLPGASEALSGFWYHQLPEFNELVFALHLLRRDDLFVDIGANQGGWSLLAAGHGARVFAFEPVPLSCDRLRANLDANSAAISRRIQVFPVGLGAQSGQVRFTSSLDSTNHRIADWDEPGSDAIVVQMVRADDVLRDEAPVLIRLDVEGDERAVLEGARATLAKPSLCAVVMETFRHANFSRPPLMAAEAILREYEFLPVAYDPWKRELWPLLRPSDGSQNTIYVREPVGVRAWLRASAPVSALGRRI